LEGTNNALRIHYDCDHPNVWRFLDKLKSFQVKVDMQLRELREAGTAKKRKVDSYDRQRDLCERYPDFKDNPVGFVVEIAKLL
jgi:hypothetical protein